MRSRLGRRTARLAHAAAHDGHGQTGCHVVQPGSRRSSQRSDHSVPDAQPVEGCGNVESPGAMRQNPFFGGVASHARKHLEPLYLAGRRDRTAVRPSSGNKRGAVGQSARRNHNVVQFRARHDFFGSRIGCGFRSDTPKCTVGRRKTRHPGRSDPHGRRIFLPESHTHLRHIPRRSDALRSLARRGRQGGGRRFARHYGESPGHRFRDRTHEDRNPGAPRRPDHRFRNPRTTIRRRKPRQILLFTRNETDQRAASLLSGLHFERGSRHPPHRIRQVAAVQRYDLRHRSALLPVDRGQTPHLCRQRPAPALPGTRRQFDQ